MAQTVTLPPLVRGMWCPMTWEEFLDWCDEGQSEWVNGWGIVHPSQALLPVFSMSLLSTRLHVFDRGMMLMPHYLMRLPTIPSPRSPDIVIVLPEHDDRITTWWREGPADFVVEHRSEDGFERDMGEKREEYERAGVPEYLAVDARYDRGGFTFPRRDNEGSVQPAAPDGRGRYYTEIARTTIGRV